MGEATKRAEVFYDDAHFTDHGSSLLADAVAAHLLERESLQKSVADGR